MQLEGIRVVELPNIGPVQFAGMLLADMGADIVRVEAPGCMTVAEESTAFPGVSAPTFAGGLGFHYKWNMGWMHDTLEYMQQDPVHRRWHHDKLGFGLVYGIGRLAHQFSAGGKRAREVRARERGTRRGRRRPARIRDLAAGRRRIALRRPGLRAHVQGAPG